MTVCHLMLPILYHLSISYIYIYHVNRSNNVNIPADKNVSYNKKKK